MIEKKQFILKLSPVNTNRSPKFPKCSHNVHDKLNEPLTKAPVDEDVDDFRYESIHDIPKQFVTSQDQDESPDDIKGSQKTLALPKKKSAVTHKKEYYYNEPDNEAEDISDLLNYETLIDSQSLLKPLVKRTTTTKGKEKTKPKHRNKYIYYTPNKEDATQVVDIVTKPPKTLSTYWNQQTQKLQHAIKPFVTHRTHNTKTQKIQSKENPKHIKPIPKIDNLVSETHSQKHKIDKEHPGHTSHSTEMNTLLNTKKHKTSQELQNTPQLEIKAETTNFGVDIYLSTIQPYFNELQKQKSATVNLGHLLADSQKSSIKYGQDSDLDSTPIDRIYNKLLRPKIMRILKIDKSKRFSMDPDFTTEESGDDKAVPTTPIHELNKSIVA